jgi:hypothetical protein
MVQIQIVIDLVEPGQGRRRAERMAALPGVPAVGEYVDVARMLALKVTAVRWDAIDGTVLILLGAGDTKRDSVIDHGGELELAQYHVDDLLAAGWDVGDYE